ncbi:cytidine deaminase [Microbulbifer litoralis]|uniref:cytidine deaminase n=1 Tax=Microbulbifer litoralis TaxID=2933965 RepID=UPI002028AD29|nr:cytidine deaminase [Microbulbifer sp. GX H0434]
MQENSPTTETALQDFPGRLRATIGRAAGNGGIISAAVVRHTCEALEIDVEQLMLRLVPVAAAYGVAPVSRYPVGAVARGTREDSHGYAQLYLGANMEFPGRALCYSLHAEQAAVANAWNSREPGLSSLAVSAPPCGLCRQFLHELSESRPLRVVFPDGARRDYCETDTAALLPGAFGPTDLGHKGNMMAVNDAPATLPSAIDGADPLFLDALEAARFSYAPYTGNRAGCALQLEDGSVFSGSYAENAAHNPGLSPLHAALSNMRMALGPGALPAAFTKLARCVLVESTADISQRQLLATLLSSFAADVALEYHPLRADNN